VVASLGTSLTQKTPTQGTAETLSVDGVELAAVLAELGTPEAPLAVDTELTPAPLAAETGLSPGDTVLGRLASELGLRTPVHRRVMSACRASKSSRNARSC
jgi:sulfur carrier protein ThiS